MNALKPSSSLATRKLVEDYLLKSGSPREGAEVRFRCPNPNHTDSHPSAHYNPEKGVWICRSCRASGTASDLAALFGLQGITPIPKMVATYNYVDGMGAIRYQVVRYEPKSFKVRRPDPDNAQRWVYNLQGVRPLLYNLPLVLGLDFSKRPAPEVWVVEGEKDADTLVNTLHRVAVTNAKGAGAEWLPEFSEALANTAVVICPDADQPGWRRALQVAQQILPVASSVQIAKLPFAILNSHGLDISDWVEQFSAEQVEENNWSSGKDLPFEYISLTSAADIVVLAQKVGLKPTLSLEAAPEAWPLTDSGNAERFIARNSAEFRYVLDLRQWLVWSGTHWQEDAGDVQVTQAMLQTIRSLYQDADIFDGRGNEATAGLLRKWGKRSESLGSLQAALTLASLSAELVIDAERLDTHPWLLNVLNGTINLKTGKLQPHNRSDLLTMLIPITRKYDRFQLTETYCPTWLRFLDTVSNHDREMVSFLQRAVGYSLTGITSERCLFILHGTGANGKSVFVRAISSLLGPYAKRTPVTSLLSKNLSSNANNDIARLKGARFVHTSEVGEGKSLDEALVKDITGGEVISARLLFKEFFEFLPEFKIWMSTNPLPVIKGTDPAIWMRIRLIPFQVTIPMEDRLPADTLHAKFGEEREEILEWAIQGCLAWQTMGLRNDGVQTATDAYRQEMDLLQQWIDEETTVWDAGSRHSTPFSRLYDSYLGWCSRTGEKPLSGRMFAQNLKTHGYEKYNNGKAIVYKGLTIRQAEPMKRVQI